MGEVSGALAGRGGAGRDPAVRLPPRRSSFVGRTAELGKTALAIEAAWIEVSAGRAIMACYIDLVPCRTDEQVVAALVEGVGIRGAAATAGLDAVAEAVSSGQSLLVLDNCEHVLESARRACDHLAGRATERRLPDAGVSGADVARWLELAPRYGLRVVGPPIPEAEA